MRSDSVLVVHRDVRAAALKTENAALASLAVALVGTVRAVVVEEAVQTSTVDVDDARVDDAETVAVCCWDGVAVGFDGGVGE